MSTVINSNGEDGEHVPVDMELTCTDPQDGALSEQVTVSCRIRSSDPFTLAGITVSWNVCTEEKQSRTLSQNLE